MRRYTLPSYIPRSIRKKEKNTQKRLIVNIIIGLVLLYFIFAWGLPALIGSLSVLNKFKSTPSHKEAAVDTTIAPPVLNIPFEATNSSSIKISGYTAPKSQVKIYLDDQLKATINAGDDGTFSTEPVDLALGTNNISGKSVDDKNHESLPSKTIKITYNNEKPKLDLQSPADNSQVKGGDKKITVAGTTDPNSNVTVNGITVIVGNDGHFFTDVSLNDGDNNIVIVATNQVGNATQIQRKVNYSS